MPDKIQNWLNEFCSALPCLITYTKGRGIKVDWGKILQSLIIVAIIASSTSFVTVKVLEAEFSNLKGSMVDVKKDIDGLDKNIDEIAANVNKIEEKQEEFDQRIGKLEDR